MKKVLFTAIAVFGFTLANAQSNQKGTMHINVMGGLFTGNATTEDDVAGSTKYTTNGSAFGAHFQYGLNEKISIGIGLEGGTVVLSRKDYNPNNSNYNNDLSLTTFKVNFSGRYYFLNVENYNIYAGPSVGYTTATNDAVLSNNSNIIGASLQTKYSGLNYGVNVGGNYFFTEIVGVIVNLGYEGNSLKYTRSQDNLPDVEGTAAIGGFKAMAGLALKF